MKTTSKAIEIVEKMLKESKEVVQTLSKEHHECREEDANNGLMYSSGKTELVRTKRDKAISYYQALCDVLKELQKT